LGKRIGSKNSRAKIAATVIKKIFNALNKGFLRIEMTAKYIDKNLHA